MLTVKPLSNAPPVLSGFVTVTSRAPGAVGPAITNVAVSRDDDTNATFVTEVPVPALTVAPLTKPLPSIVTGTVAPIVPWFGVTALTATTVLGTIAEAWTVAPSDNVTVTARVRPGPNPCPPP